MKFLILSHYISPDVKGGSYDVAFGIAKALAKYSQVTLISFIPEGIGKEKFEKINNISIFRIPEKKFTPIYLKEEYDVVIIHSPIMFFKYLFSRKIKKPIFYFVHSPTHIERFQSIQKKDIKYYVLKLLEKIFYTISDTLLFGSQYMENVANLSFKEKKKSFIIPFGINKPDNLTVTDSNEIKILNTINEDIINGYKIILSVRGLKPRTGVDNLIKAFSYLRNQKVKLYIGGNGPLFFKLQELIKELNLENNVFLLGSITDELKFNLFSISYLSVMPTISLEGFGISILESMYAGCPAIVTPVGGMYEFYINNGLEELITNTIEPESIARRIEQLLQEPDKIEYFREKSLILAKGFDFNDLGEIYLKKFSYILELLNSRISAPV